METVEIFPVLFIGQDYFIPANMYHDGESVMFKPSMNFAGGEKEWAASTLSYGDKHHWGL